MRDTERADYELEYQGVTLRYYRVPFPAWGCELWAVATPEGGYYSIRALSVVLGIASQMQVRRLQDHHVLRRLVRQLPMPTEKRGMRPTWVIQERGIGFWFGTMQTDTIRPELLDTMIAFQEAAVDALDSLIRGHLRLSAPASHGDRLAMLENELTRVTAYARMLETRIGRIEGATFGELREPDEGEE